MIRGYSVKRTSVAQAPFYAIAAWERNGKPIVPHMQRKQVLELMECYSMVGRRCFNEVNEYI